MNLRAELRTVATLIGVGIAHVALSADRVLAWLGDVPRFLLDASLDVARELGDVLVICALVTIAWFIFVATVFGP